MLQFVNKEIHRKKPVPESVFQQNCKPEAAILLERDSDKGVFL